MPLTASCLLSQEIIQFLHNHPSSSTAKVRKIANMALPIYPRIPLSTPQPLPINLTSSSPPSAQDPQSPQQRLPHPAESPTPSTPLDRKPPIPYTPSTNARQKESLPYLLPAFSTPVSAQPQSSSYAQHQTPVHHTAFSPSSIRSPPASHTHPPTPRQINAVPISFTTFLEHPTLPLDHLFLPPDPSAPYAFIYRRPGTAGVEVPWIKKEFAPIESHVYQPQLTANGLLGPVDVVHTKWSTRAGTTGFSRVEGLEDPFVEHPTFTASMAHSIGDCCVESVRTNLKSRDVAPGWFWCRNHWTGMFCARWVRIKGFPCLECVVSSSSPFSSTTSKWE